MVISEPFAEVEELVTVRDACRNASAGLNHDLSIQVNRALGWQVGRSENCGWRARPSPVQRWTAMRRPASELEDALRFLAEPWFLWSLGEDVKPIVYRGDAHEPLGFHAHLQCRAGGQFTSASGAALHLALCAALIDVRVGERSKRWHR